MSVQPHFQTAWLSLLVMVGGLVALVGGGELLVAGSTRLANRCGMSPVLIGLTVVAFGTSIPELFVSLTATLKGHVDIMVGNVIGSNIANVGLVLGVSALLVPLRIRLAKIATELCLLLAAGVCVAGLAYTGYFPRLVGILFVGGLVLYTYLAYRAAHKGKRSNPAAGRRPAHSFLQIAFLVAAGLLFLAVGSEYFIKGAVDIARVLGVSELVIGLTLAAVGTSLPELASSFSAIRHRESDLLIGNVVGSNLFNLLMVMGGTAVVAPFAISADVLARDVPVMIVFSAVLLPFLYFYQAVTRAQGMVLLTAYAGYIAWLA